MEQWRPFFCVHVNLRLSICAWIIIYRLSYLVDTFILTCYVLRKAVMCFASQLPKHLLWLQNDPDSRVYLLGVDDREWMKQSARRWRSRAWHTLTPCVWVGASFLRKSWEQGSGKVAMVLCRSRRRRQTSVDEFLSLPWARRCEFQRLMR